MRQCWDANGGCLQLLQSDISRILDDPRHAALDLNARRRQPLQFLANAFGESLLGSLLVCGCHRSLIEYNVSAGLLQESEERLCLSLSSIAEGVILMLVRSL